MFTGSLAPQSRLGDFIETLELADADSPHDLIDLSTATALTASICFPDNDTALLGKSLGSGVTLPSTGVVQWSFPAAEMRTLRPGAYRFLLIATVAPSGQVVPIVDALLPLV